MKCTEVNLNAYLDSELDAKTYQQVAQHLVKCQHCRQELEELKAVNSFLAGWESQEVPPRLTLAVLNPNHFKPAAKTLLGRLANLAAVASFGFALFVGGLLGQASFSQAQTLSATASNNTYSNYATALESENLYQYLAEVSDETLD